MTSEQVAELLARPAVREAWDAYSAEIARLDGRSAMVGFWEADKPLFERFISSIAEALKPAVPPTTAQGVTPAERDKLAELIFLVNTARMSPDEIGDPAEPNEQEYELADALLEAGYSRAPSSAPPTQEPVAFGCVVLDKSERVDAVRWGKRARQQCRAIADELNKIEGIVDNRPFIAQPLYLAAPPAPPRIFGNRLPDDAPKALRRTVDELGKLYDGAASLPSSPTAPPPVDWKQAITEMSAPSLPASAEQPK